MTQKREWFSDRDLRRKSNFIHHHIINSHCINKSQQKSIPIEKERGNKTLWFDQIYLRERERENFTYFLSKKFCEKILKYKDESEGVVVVGAEVEVV